VTISRRALSRLLFETLESSTETTFGDEIIALDERKDDVIIRLKSGGERRFDLVIGADGLHSTVRRLAFGPQDRFEKRLGYIVAVFEADGYQPRDVDVYVTYSEPGRMVGRVSLRYDKRLFLSTLSTASNRVLSGSARPSRRRLASACGFAIWSSRPLRSRRRTSLSRM